MLPGKRGVSQAQLSVATSRVLNFEGPIPDVKPPESGVANCALAIDESGDRCLPDGVPVATAASERA